MNLRRSLMSVHRWVGLAMGVLVLASALTGSGLAFRDELDPLARPREVAAGRCAAPLPLDALVARAAAIHPGGAIDYLRIRAGAGAPLIVHFDDEDSLYLDRCTGALTARQNRYAGLFGRLEWIHRGRWLPHGAWIMGAGALALLAMTATGAFLWWPRRPRRFSDGFVLDRRLRGPAFVLGLHRTAGAWAALMLATSALTALPIAFDELKAALSSIGAPARTVEPRSTPAPGAPRITLQDAWRTVQRLSPSPREVLMHVPHTPNEPIAIFMIDAHAPHANARSYVDLDAYSGRVLAYRPYAQTSLGSRIYFWLLSVHTGQVGGIFGQLALFCGVLLVPLLVYTSFQSYLRRWLRKRSTARLAAASAASSGR